MTVQGKRLNKAIVDKVINILSNTDEIVDLDIQIHGEMGCGTSIRYKITERIVPKESTHDKRDN